MVQYWKCPLLLMVSLIAVAQQTPAESNNKAGLQQQPSPLLLPGANKEHPSSVQQLTPADWASQNNNNKRSWNQLQGVWGKRSPGGDEDTGVEDIEETEGQGNMFKRSWNQLQGVWGKRSSSSDESSEDADNDLENEKRSSGWNKMQGVWGKRSGFADPEEDEEQQYDDDNDDQFQGQVNKRSWNQLQGVWGKRSKISQQEMDKRAWNQLQGTWGKRMAQQLQLHQQNHQAAVPASFKRNWNSLRGAWGKREMPVAPSTKGNEWSRKRESGWNNLKGLWG